MVSQHTISKQAFGPKLRPNQDEEDLDGACWESLEKTNKNQTVYKIDGQLLYPSSFKMNPILSNKIQKAKTIFEKQVSLVIINREQFILKKT